MNEDQLHLPQSSDINAKQPEAEIKKAKIGRPRTSVPEVDELIELGKDLVEWATEPTEELRCRYCQWYCLRQGFTSVQWDHMLQKPEFRVYYEMAQAALGQRIVDGSINASIGHRFIWYYVPESKKQDIEKMTKDAEIKKKAFEDGTADLSDYKAWLNEKKKKT